jgi:hypothetical protein
VRQPRVEILYFEGCPHHEEARVLVERVAAALQLRPIIALVEVTDPDSAVALRFLGSPSVRVDGLDIEPGAEERRDFGFSCRIYRGERGVSEQPDESWVREALTEAAK